MKGPPLGPGGEDITWPDQVAPRGRKASSTRKIKPCGTWCCGGLLCGVLCPVVFCGAVLGLVARGCPWVACFDVGVPVWPHRLLAFGWRGLLWCPAPPYCVLWCCAVVSCCADVFDLCCSSGVLCLRCLVLLCVAVCCTVYCGVLWCAAGSGCPRLSFGGVFWRGCPCLAAWPAPLWLL